MAMGTSGTVLTSPDGITWTSQTSGTLNPLYCVTWTGNQLVAGGGGFSATPINGMYVYKGVILTSPDGVTWTSRISGTTSDLRSVVSTGTKLVAVGGVDTSGIILTSP